MVELTPSQKGAIAEAAITSEVIQLGFVVLRPLCEGRRYDLVVDLEPRLLRVQCKLALRIGGALAIRVQSSRYTPKGYVCKPYSATEIDAIAAYSPEVRGCFLLPIAEITTRQQTYLRLEPTRNNQAERIKWADDYRLDAVVRRLRHAGPQP